MYLLNLQEVDIDDRKTVGGKGASLGEMLDAGIPIPPGFCITASAFKAFYGKKMPRSFISEILLQFDRLETKRVAVRSSAVAEDSQSASWAGQLESYLNVTRDGLIKNIKKCWKSIHSPRANAYAEKEGVSEDKKLVSVVVQKMVDSDFSGVMFSVNPINQNRGEIMVESAYGLGEGIVQGLVTPDNFIISKKRLQIIKKTINSKNKQVIYEGGSTIEKKVGQNLKDKQSISDVQVVQLAKLAVKIEKHYKVPQDMEWVVEGKDIFIVQSRPITTLTREKKVDEEADIYNDRLILTGLGASSGVRSGKVRLIKKLKDILQTRTDEVLVAESTTPDFVEAFTRAVAVVTDQGGITSHAAIVSREMGIPAVVGTGEATTKLKNGDEITVDGNSGKVYMGKLDIKTAGQQFRKMEKLKSTGNDIDDLLLVIQKTLPPAGELWPLRPGQLFPYIDMDQALDFYSKLKQLRKDDLTTKMISSLFPHPSSLKLFILNSAATGLKVANSLNIGGIRRGDQIKLIQWCIDILKQIVPDDPLNLQGRNRLLNAGDVHKLVRKTKWIPASPENKENLNLLGISLFNLMWSFYWDYFPNAGNELSGPYFVGDNDSLIVRDWFNTSPNEVWELAEKVGIESVRLMQIYSTRDVFINFGNRVFFEDDPNKMLVKFNLQVDGEQVTEAKQIKILAKRIAKVAKEQTNFVNGLTDIDKVRKGAMLAYFSLKDFYLHFRSDWYPRDTVERSIETLGDKFVTKNKELNDSYKGNDRIKMFDPRNSFLP